MKYIKNFVSFEGCEGVGKSTQVKYLEKYLTSIGQDAVFTREPGGTPLAEKIRNLILTENMSAESEALLFAAARADHIDNVILPSVNAGKMVICDRYIHSSLAYQAFARGLGEEKVLAYNAYAVDNCMPDVTVFIDMNPANSWRRQKGSVVPDDRMEKESDRFHQAVYQGFLALAKDSRHFISVVPQSDKEATARSIIDALKARGVIS